MGIFEINSLPLQDAFIHGQDEIVDSLLIHTSKQTYIKRIVYILHVMKDGVVKNFNYNYLQILFSKVIKNDLNFERIIFQRQFDGSIIILLHCSYINKLVEINKDQIIKFLTDIFVNYRIFVDLFLEARLLDIMQWRASQPFHHLLPQELQWSSISNIGFCGDWFDSKSCKGVESAIHSSIRLAKLLNWK